MQSETLKKGNPKRSDMLKKLYELRENLDRKSSKTPDYHIREKKDYHIKTEVKVDEPKKREHKKTEPKKVATQKVRQEITELFNYGFDLGRTQISVTAETNKKIDTFRFNDKYQIASVLTEYSKNADLIVFLVDTNNDTIFWYNYGAYEVRVFKQ